ncbi:MAG: ribose ABC transporter substrate-binding protein RbsB [Syntrophothermus sp.]
MKKLAVIFMVAVLAGGLLGVFGLPAGAEKKPVVGLAVSTLNNPFFVDLKDGALEAAKKLGIELVVTDAQNDPNKQLAGIEDLIQRGVDVILVNPTDSAAVVPAIKAANKAKIPVITVDRSAAQGEVATHIASDNVAGGRMAGEYIVKLLGGKGKVVELEGIPGTSAARDRGKGFNEVIAKNGGIKVVARQEAGFDRARGLTVMENILQAQPEINAVFAHNDEMALGALKAITASGRKGILVVGFDATDDAVAAVKEGKLAATVAQQPREMGRLAVESAKQLLSGGKLDQFIPVALSLVTK